MSTAPEPDFDLEKLFLPAWAQDSSQVNRYANFSGEDRAERRFDDRGGRRPPRRDQPGGAKPRGRRPDATERRDHHTSARQPERPAPRQEAPPTPPLPITISILPDEK